MVSTKEIIEQSELNDIIYINDYEEIVCDSEKYEDLNKQWVAVEDCVTKEKIRKKILALIAERNNPERSLRDIDNKLEILDELLED